MVDAFVAELASGLILKIISLATEEVTRAWNLHEHLETLRGRLELIDSLMSDAYVKKLTMSTVQFWFNKLEAVTHVADVFMDELTYEVTRRKVENQHKVRDFFIPSRNSILYRFKVAQKIKSINTSFDNIFKLARHLGLQPVAHLNSFVQHRDIGNSPPFVEESQIIGRDDEISYLVQTVCKDHEEILPVIGVVGMGGQGKTALARMVYNSDAVISMFPKRMWVTVSDNFNFMNVMNEMIEILTSTNLGLKNTQGVINVLQERLKGVRFLLVLDDIWNRKPDEWEKLRDSLLGIGSARGSIILVTTRDQEVIDAMRCSVYHRLEKLSEEYSWELFKKRAFAQGGVLETEPFVALGRRMVESCGGLPLAIKTLGGLLHSKKSEKEWLLIQNSELWKSDGVLSSLRLSYDNLPYPSLKRCFVYCSVLPKDSRIYKDELIQIWMALGFLLPPSGRNVLMEDIGNDYFNILLWKSLLQDVERDALGNIISCKMHDLVHDLAIDISKYHSITVKEGMDLKFISDAVYVRFDTWVSNVNPLILNRNFERLRVLYADTLLVRDVLPYLGQLTVLVLNKNFKAELPSSVGTLKCLKHLDISSSHNSYKLAKFITRLYNLQTLRVWGLQELPKNFCNLVNLRHLVFVKTYVDNNPESRCIFTGIERLTCLQTLPHFVVSRDKKCLISQLGGLKNLKGKLELYGLSDIKNMEEASKAKLCTKSNIESLELFWRKNKIVPSSLEYNDEVVLEGLKPHTNIKGLTVVYFMGKKLAPWITMMTNLVKITLKDCHRCEGFSSLGQIPKLSEMEIIRMDDVKVIRSEFCGKTVATLYPSLTKLILWDLPVLEEWVETAAMSTSNEDRDTVIIFPKLEVLEIELCSNLKRIPSSCFPSLKHLVITKLESSMLLKTMSREVQSLTYLRLWDISDGTGSSSNIDSVDELLKNNVMSLTTINLNNCHGLTCLTIGAALQKLKVVNCPDLTSINVVEESSTLKYLISGCPLLKERSWKGSGIHYRGCIRW